MRCVRYNIHMVEILDAVIVGAGPAGLIAAHELSDLKIAVVEKGPTLSKRADILGGKYITKFVTDAEIEGIGGAGGWSDGKLCLGSVGILDQFLGNDYEKEVGLVEHVFKDVLGEKYHFADDKVGSTKLSDTLVQEITKVANLGTSTVRLAFDRIYKRAKQRGVKFYLEDSVINIRKENDYFVVETKARNVLYSRNVIVATGKCDLTLVPKLVKKFHLRTIPTNPNLGFRIIVPYKELIRMKYLGNNPKLQYQLPNGDKVKTHCFTFQGEIMDYSCDKYKFVGGRADTEHPTEFATVAILYKMSFGNPVDRKKILFRTLNLIRKDYPGKLIYQDVYSFMDCVKKMKNTSLPLPKNAVLCRLMDYYPEHVINATRTFIDYLRKTYEMAIEEAAIVGPAAEWISDAISTSIEMETSTKGLYVVGDGSGITQGIVSSAVCGYRAAHVIIKNTI